ncbi:MAG: SDR family NAD(P)-dependent oxidoreductase [Spirochaetes bacterium]|jgi:NAD(P)-dependent dehydrogenase (short-subunit alcohol dehydrogenase family)|nr:SDR family NAD(P)-dependent oxidoreductase [Spirochaetota bacterium]
MTHSDGDAVLVSGASGALGRATVTALVAHGFHVYAGYRSSADAEALRRIDPEAVTPVELDVTDAQDVEAAREAVTRPLHALIHNAGILVSRSVASLQAEELEQQLNVNVVGVARVTKAFLPHLTRPGDGRGGPGRIITISSASALTAYPGGGAYCASKSAVEMLMSALRMEISRRTLRVILVRPGFFTSPLWERAGERSPDADPLTSVSRQWGSNQARRGLPPERVARVIARAATARRPRAVYGIGKEVAAARLAGLLPASIRDWVIRANVGA